jgi:hypothetical protein
MGAIAGVVRSYKGLRRNGLATRTEPKREEAGRGG